MNIEHSPKVSGTEIFDASQSVLLLSRRSEKSKKILGIVLIL